MKNVAIFACVLGLGMGTARADTPKNVNVGLGGGVGLPGLGRFEAFATMTGPRFLPNVFAEVLFTKTSRGQSFEFDNDEANDALVFAGTTTLLARAGLITQSGASRKAFIAGKTNWASGLTSGTIETVHGIRSTGLVGGLMVESQDWQPDASAGENGPVESATTLTVIGGLHRDFASGRSDAPSTSHDLSITYGLNGPRKGLGAMYQFHIAQYGFLYAKIDLGWIFLGTHEHVPWHGALRLGLTGGFSFGTGLY